MCHCQGLIPGGSEAPGTELTAQPLLPCGEGTRRKRYRSHGQQFNNWSKIKCTSTTATNSNIKKGQRGINPREISEAWAPTEWSPAQSSNHCPQPAPPADRLGWVFLGLEHPFGCSGSAVLAMLSPGSPAKAWELRNPWLKANPAQHQLNSSVLSTLSSWSIQITVLYKTWRKWTLSQLKPGQLPTGNKIQAV